MSKTSICEHEWAIGGDSAYIIEFMFCKLCGETQSVTDTSTAAIKMVSEKLFSTDQNIGFKIQPQTPKPRVSTLTRVGEIVNELDDHGYMQEGREHSELFLELKDIVNAALGR